MFDPKKDVGVINKAYSEHIVAWTSHLVHLALKQFPPQPGWIKINFDIAIRPHATITDTIGRMNLEISYLLIQISSLLLVRLWEKHKMLFKLSRLQCTTSTHMFSLKVIPKELSRLCRTSIQLLLGSLPLFSQMSKLLLVHSFIRIFLLFLRMLISFPTTWPIGLLFVFGMDLSLSLRFFTRKIKTSWFLSLVSFFKFILIQHA